MTLSIVECCRERPASGNRLNLFEDPSRHAHRVWALKEKRISVDPRAGQPADASMLVNIPLTLTICLYQVGTPG
jgi:hypothetical protein